MSDPREAIRRWLVQSEKRPDLASSTKRSYARIAAHVDAWCASCPPAEATDLAAYARHRLDADVGPRTVRLELRVFASMLRWGQEHGLVSRDVALRLPRLRADSSPFRCNHRTPAAREVHAAIAAMPPGDWRLAVQLLARTGARAGEIVALRRADVDRRARVLWLGTHRGASKTGARAFPLGASTLALLVDRADGTDAPLLEFDGIGAPHQALATRLREACRLGGVPRFTPHGIRRMVVTRLLRSGVELATAASITGHTIQVMLRYYREVSDEDRRHATRRAGLDTIGDGA